GPVFPAGGSRLYLRLRAQGGRKGWRNTLRAYSKSRSVRLQMAIYLRSGAHVPKSTLRSGTRKSPFSHAHTAFRFRLWVTILEKKATHPGCGAIQGAAWY